MGRDKSAVRLGGRTLLARVTEACVQASIPSRVIRQDLVPACGPLGGILTALSSTSQEGVLCLSCDMPFVTPRLILRVIRRASFARRAVFAEDAEGVGFPFFLWRRQLGVVEEQIAEGKHSIQELAKRLRACRLRASRADAWERFNVNTPADLAEARRIWGTRGGTGKKAL